MMSNHLEHLAHRLQDDPFFLACPLQFYAKSENLSDEGLATRLKCSEEALLAVLLCRAPSGEDASFSEGIEQIAARFSVDSNVLADAVRRGQALFDMTRMSKPMTKTMIAARDGDVRRDGDLTKEGNP